jgi:type II secretory ATPase GspE/PulE/Tfp pilus assembly ATPase PilB-like protein
MLISNEGKTITPLDESLVNLVAIDVANNRIYLEETTHWKPLMLTWIKRNERNGVNFEIVYRDLDEVAQLRTNGMRAAEAVDDDQVTLPKAIELIKMAAAYNASDIHLQLRGDHTEIQFVLKGELRTYQRKTQEEGVLLARAIYQGLAKTKAASWNQLDFQGAQIPDDMLPPDLSLTSARIIRGPMYPVGKGGAFMTIRLQYSETRYDHLRKFDLPPLPLPRRPAGEFNLLEAGYSHSNVEKLDLLMSAPHGIVIVTGPTGSGKTTLLYHIMKEKARRNPGMRQVTIEDPVELPFEWGVQLPVTGTKGDVENGEAFAERGQTALRMAPNTLMFGEARGAAVALEVVRGAQTGHDTWTTSHVSDPFQAVERWETLDPVRLNRKIFCDPVTLRGLVGVRLLPALCKCAKGLGEAGDVVPARILNALRTWGPLDAVKVRGDGCKACGFDGVVGRKAVCEVVVNDEALADDIINKDVTTARKNYRARPDADPSMLEASIQRVLRGEVDPRDVEKRVELITPCPEDRRALVLNLRGATQEISRTRNLEAESRDVSPVIVAGAVAHA